MKLVHFRRWLNVQRREALARRVIRNGEKLQVLYRERGIMQSVGMHDPVIDSEIERRERLRTELLDKFKKED